MSDTNQLEDVHPTNLLNLQNMSSEDKPENFSPKIEVKRLGLEGEAYGDSPKMQESAQKEGSYSPRIITQNRGRRPVIEPMDAQAAKEYERKIIQKKKESYKYARNEEQSQDDRMKTKQLL